MASLVVFSTILGGVLVYIAGGVDLVMRYWCVRDWFEWLDLIEIWS